MSGLDRPEGLLGTILAFEGIQDAMIIVNGPTGCKYYPASASESSYRNRPEGPQTYNPYRYRDEFFFNQPRVPCTHMDGNDYIMGTRGRLNRAADAVMRLSPSMIGLVNSPGASLIGEDLSLECEPDVPVIRMESPSYSASMGEGFQNAVVSVLEATDAGDSDAEDTVNLIGISVWHLGWNDSLNDLKALLGLCGIRVNAAVCAGCSVEELRRSFSARLNVVIHEEFGLRVAEWYGSAHGIPYVNPGVPIGFDAVERFISDICGALGKDPSPAMDAVRSRRRRAANVLSCLGSSRRPPRGRTFSVSGDGSMVFGICRFLYGYLGMVPAAVDTGMDETWDDRIRDFVDGNGLDVTDDVFNTPCDVIIGDGNLIASAMQRHVSPGGAVIGRPGLVNMNVEERPVIGLGGTVRLLDSVLNVLERSGNTH